MSNTYNVVSNGTLRGYRGADEVSSQKSKVLRVVHKHIINLHQARKPHPEGDNPELGGFRGKGRAFTGRPDLSDPEPEGNNPELGVFRGKGRAFTGRPDLSDPEPEGDNPELGAFRGKGRAFTGRPDLSDSENNVHGDEEQAATPNYEDTSYAGEGNEEAGPSSGSYAGDPSSNNLLPRYRSSKRSSIKHVHQPGQPPSPSDSLMDGVHRNHQQPPPPVYHEPLHPTAGINPYIIIVPVILFLLALISSYLLSYSDSIVILPPPLPIICNPDPPPVSCNDVILGPVI